MFYTSPDAEHVLPAGLATAGQRAWRYVELGLQVPYFLVSVRFVDGDLEIGQHLLLSQLTDLLGLAAQQNEQFWIDAVRLLSPGYMNTGEGYSLGQLKEIWVDKATQQNKVFVLSDGTRLKYQLDEFGDPEPAMELILAV